MMFSVMCIGHILFSLFLQGAFASAVPVTCDFTIDDYIFNVYIDGVDRTNEASGNLLAYYAKNTITFDSSASTIAVFGKDLNQGCGGGGFVMKCTSSDPNWNGVKSDTSWKVHGTDTKHFRTGDVDKSCPAGWATPNFDVSNWPNAKLSYNWPFLGAEAAKTGVANICGDNNTWCFRKQAKAAKPIKYPNCGNSGSIILEEYCMCGAQKAMCGPKHYCYDNKCVIIPKPLVIRVPVTCDFTVDDFIFNVYIDGVDRTNEVSGNLMAYYAKNTITFDASASTIAVFGKDVNHGCGGGGFIMKCTSSDPNWNGLKSDTSWRVHGTDTKHFRTGDVDKSCPAGWAAPSFDASSWPNTKLSYNWPFLGAEAAKTGVANICGDNNTWCFRKQAKAAVLPHCTDAQAKEPCLCGPKGRITCRKGLYCHGFDNEYKSQCKNQPEEPEYPDCGNSETTKVKEYCVCGVQKTTCGLKHYCYDNKCTTKPKPQPVQPTELPDCGSSFTKKIKKKRCVCGKNKVACGKKKYCYDDMCNKKAKSVEPVVRGFNPNRAEVEVGEEGQLVGGLNMAMYGGFMVMAGFLGFYVGQREPGNSSKYKILPDGDEVAMVSYKSQHK